MSKAKKIFLLNERRETWRITLRGQRTAFCPVCDATVEWLSTRDSMQLLNKTELAVVTLAAAASVHSQEDDRGFLFFCRASLEKLKPQEEGDEKS